ncbi:hypothetical protein F1643_00220 [Azospirillum sp. INR13]|uniref:hypothetical protein n=1 Tax=Azospirillum sp. INR13 TaxID=2596919 RepID=UPI0018925E91|nr:hypothetical protein [Azospirillum sp. INR13]MBF5093113.1 hypothetical protein [Azospirillum sp. INR13]
MLFEVDPDVTAYKAQPGSFSYGPLGMRRFVPDFEVVRQGRTRYVEVKPMRWARRPETNRELRAKKAAMESLGHEYRVLTEMELQREPRLSNVRQLFHCHQHGRTVADEVEVRRILGRCDGMSIDRLARAMEGIHAVARIMGLICGGVLSFDDRTALCPDTVVRLCGE